MVDKQVRIDLTATDDASRVVDDLAASVGKLEDSDPKIEISADGDAATGEIADVQTKADALADKPIRLTVEAGMSGVLGDLSDLRDSLDKTEAKAKTTDAQLDRVGGEGGGTRLRGNSIADLTGPLGDVSGQASNLAGVFDGIGDIVEQTAGKVGLNAAAMAGAIGGVGFAIVAATALWGVFTGAQEKARQKQKELVDGQQALNDKISEGNYQQAAEQFTKLYSGAVAAAGQLGVPTKELVDFITGVTDAVPTATAALDAVNAAGAQLGPTFVNGRLVMGTQVAGMVQSITDARTQFETTNGTLAVSKDRVDDYADALAASTGNTDANADAQTRLKDATDHVKDGFDAIRKSLDMGDAFDSFYADMNDAMTKAGTSAGNTSTDIRGLKDDVLAVAQFAQLNPIEVQALLDKIDAGDYTDVKEAVEQLSRNNPAIISARLAKVTVPMQGSGAFGQDTVTGTSTSVTNVFHMGPGTRAADIVREVGGVTRRHGERFAANGRR